MQDLIIYFNLFLLMFSNGFISFPSSQLIYLSLGYILKEKTYLEVFCYIFIGATGNALGNYFLFYIFKYKKDFFKKYIEKYLKVSFEKIESYREKAGKHLFYIVFTGKLIPSVKVFIPILAAFFDMKRSLAFIAFLLGSIVWGITLTFIGYYFGKSFDLKTFFICLLVIYLFIGFAFRAKSKK